MSVDMSKVHEPEHYVGGRSIQPWDAIRDWKLNFNLGSVVKYVSRAGRKESALEDLYKAKEYLTKEIECMEAEVKKAEAERKAKEALPKSNPCRCTVKADESIVISSKNFREMTYDKVKRLFGNNNFTRLIVTEGEKRYVVETVECDMTWQVETLSIYMLEMNGAGRMVFRFGKKLR